MAAAAAAAATATDGCSAGALSPSAAAAAAVACLAATSRTDIPELRLGRGDAASRAVRGVTCSCWGAPGPSAVLLLSEAVSPKAASCCSTEGGVWGFPAGCLARAAAGSPAVCQVLEQKEHGNGCSSCGTPQHIDRCKPEM